MATKIYIDQGHNPQNPNAGAEGNGLQEQTITYRIGEALAALLRANPDFEVRLSRPSPDTILGTSSPYQSRALFQQDSVSSSFAPGIVGS